MSITHCGRAVDELKKGGFKIDKIKEGRSGVSELKEVDVENILNWSKYNIFESLNRAGKLLKDSSWTRLTTHKKYDFALIQSQSNANCESYRQKLRELIKAQDAYSQEVNLEEKTKQRIASGARRYLNDAVKELKKVYELAKQDDNLKKELDEFEKKTEQEKIEYLKQAFEKFHGEHNLNNRIVFAKDEEAAKNSQPQSGSSGGSGGDGIAILGLVWTGVATLVLVSGSLIVGTVMIGIFPGLPAALAIGSLVIGSVIDYRKATAKKRQFMKLNDHFSKAIRKLNECQKYLEHQTLRELKQSPLRANMNDQVFDSTTNFLNTQAELWEHYITSHAREYEKNKARQVVNDTHRSGSKIVSDEKADRHGYQKRLGLTKQGVAASWCELPTVFSGCYNKYYKQPE